MRTINVGFANAGLKGKPGAKALKKLAKTQLEYLIHQNKIGRPVDVRRVAVLEATGYRVRPVVKSKPKAYTIRPGAPVAPVPQRKSFFQKIVSFFKGSHT
jgi:hypothetical protein